MNSQRKHAGAALAVVLALVGCDQKGDVNKQIEDLKEAERESPQQAAELKNELDKAKGDVVRLEEKVALAKQGVTDDVVKEQEELKQALGHQEREVQEDVKEAQGKARALNTDVNKAQGELQRVQSAQRVKAQVTTETQVVPSTTEVAVEKQQQQMPIEQNKLVERQNTQPAPTTTTRSTTTGQAVTGQAVTGQAGEQPAPAH